MFHICMKTERYRYLQKTKRPKKCENSIVDLYLKFWSLAKLK